MKKKLKTIVIDHSETQRKVMTYLVKRHPNLDLILEVGKEDQFPELFAGPKPDLILLDIEFPGLDGSEFMQLADTGIQLVLVTSTSSYALEAFDFGITDYIIKPVTKHRFREAISKVLIHYDILHMPVKDDHYINVKADHDIKKISLAEIRWIEALGDYVKIITIRERILALSTLTSIEEQLPGDKFLRIHRSYIVNLDKVENFSSTSVEVEGQNLPMSRKRKARLEAKLIPDT